MDDRRRATLRLASETAQSRGLRRPAPTDSLPRAGVRDLLEAAEELVRRGVHPPAPLLEALAAAGTPDPVHPLGLGFGPSDRTCGDCAWGATGRCLQTTRPGRAGRKVDKNWQACARWETRLSEAACGSCGACCREGYALAPVHRGETMALLHPEWVLQTPLGRCLPRPDGRCVALEGDGTTEAPWRCRDYAARMRACSELAVESKACLTARRRVGLSR